MAESRALIYLEGNKLSFYVSGLEHPLILAFPTAGVSSMEVLNKESIYNQIQSFAVSNKLIPSTCSIILGNDMVFQKVIRQTQQVQKEEMIKEFLNNVPFDNVSHISYDSTDTTYIFGTNEELFTTVRRGFEKLGFSVDVVIPVALFANANIPSGTPLTTQTGEFIISNIEGVKQHNFINVRQETAQKAAKKSNNPTAKKNRRNEKVLGGVFTSLLVVLLVVFLTNKSTVAPKNTQAAPPPAAQQPQAPAITTPTGVAQGSSAPEAYDKTAVKIKIIAPTSQVSANKIQTALTQAGFVSITNEATSSAAPSVSFSKIAQESVKNDFLGIVRPIVADFTVLSHEEEELTIILTLGN